LFLAASPTFEESFRAGLTALQRNDLAAAAENLEAAAKLAPENGRVWVALSQAYWKRQESGKAEAAAGKAASLAPEDAAVQQSLAIYYSETGQKLKAARAQAKYASKVPQSAEARDRAGALYFEAAQPLLEKQNFADAIAVLREAHTQVPNQAQIELALGVACYGLRRFEEAADAFLRTIAIDPEIEQPYVFLGKFLDQIPSRLPEVTAKFVEYEAKHPESYAGPLLHAKALDAQSIEPETSRKLLEKALAMNDRDASAHFELGTVLDRLQKFDEAAHEFEQAIALDASDPAAHYRLARDYDRLGKHDAAQAERERHAKLVKAQDAVR
jgi:tetratricopeptide (TPR) repeat protein